MFFWVFDSEEGYGVSELSAIEEDAGDGVPVFDSELVLFSTLRLLDAGDTDERFFEEEEDFMFDSFCSETQPAK